MLEEGPSGRWRCKTKSGGPRLAEHGWAGLSDLYEPCLLLPEEARNFESPDDLIATLLGKCSNNPRAEVGGANQDW